MTITLSSEDYPIIEIPEDKNGLPLITTSDIVELVPIIQDKRNEYLLCISVDGDRRPLSIRIVAIGSRNQATLSIPDILRSALSDGASGIIMVHNHPSGSAKHSKGDISAMESVEDAAKLVGLTFLDSIVVCGEDYSTLPTEYKREHQIESARTAKSYILLIIDAIENIGNTMSSIGLVALSFIVFFMSIDAISGNLSVEQLLQIRILILLYPLCWCMKIGAQIAKRLFE